MNNFFSNNVSSRFFRVDENLRLVEQEVWPNAGPAYKPGSAFVSHKIDVRAVRAYNTQSSSSSSNTAIEDVTRDDWEGYLLRKTIPSHSTPVNYPSTSLVQHVGKIGQPKRHYAHVSFIPSAHGHTSLSTDQVAVLEEVFRGKPFITREERSILARKLAITDQAIKVWYQNRRLLEKKEREELELELLQGLPENNPFAHTEVLINQADKDGLVTLDQQSIDELVSAIDKTLPKDLDLSRLVFDLRRTMKVEESVTDIVNESNSQTEVGTSRQVSCTQDWRKLETIESKQSFLGLLGIQSLNCGL